MTAMITPFDKSGALELSALPPILEFQRSAGIEGVVVGGTNGEGTSLSVDERKDLLQTVLDWRRDHARQLAVVAGTGAASVLDAVELTRHAGLVGADAVLVLPPFYIKNPAPSGVAAYFRQVLDASSVPVLLYSIPRFTAVEITDEILRLLKGHPRLAGLKDSSGEWARTGELLRRRDLLAFPGSDRLQSRGLEAGTIGSISGAANGLPEIVTGVKRAFRAGGDVVGAQARLDRALDILLEYPLIAVNKSILARRGLPRLWVRPPLVDLTPAQEDELIGRLETGGLLA